MHWIFTEFVLICSAGRGKQMRVFHDHLQETAAVNAHAHVSVGLNQDYTHTRMQHTHMFMCCLEHRRVCKHVQYIHPHALQICPCWSRRTYAGIEEEYEMRRCNYMANVVMIWCLNISAVLCCAGTLAIHSQGQAGSQRHETHESECVHPTRELAVQLEIFMIGSVLKAPRR